MSIYPFSFWVVIALLLIGLKWSIKRIKNGIGIPMLSVIVTVSVWYVGDALYNDYSNIYTVFFGPDILQNAWWQVAWFMVVFLAAAPHVHQRLNARYLGRESGVLRLARFGIDDPTLQQLLNFLFGVCVVLYTIIVLLAAIRLKSQILYFFSPYFGYKADPWTRERIGSGFDALLSLAFYIQLLLTTIFGVVAAASNNKRICIFSVALCFLSWPYFLFDRTRNTILVVVIPATLCWVVLRIRGCILKKIFILCGCFILLDGWMGFIIQNRTSLSIAMALHEKGFNLKEDIRAHHDGLNMFEELCWIDAFIQAGTFEPDWGERYFAELVNPIPRALWHGKPLIGIDYAQARGQGFDGSGGKEKRQANIYATISTGLIGQGVVNFGTIFGPAAAALLMSIWVTILARLDLRVDKLGFFPLYALGLILTFNLGRDITFITLYPFVFGLAAVWFLDRYAQDYIRKDKPSELG